MKYNFLAKGGFVAVAIAALALGPAAGREPQPEAGLFPIALSNDLLLEFTQPKSGQEAAATQWSQQHLKQFVQIPGVKAAQFLVTAGAGVSGKPDFQYISMYELTANSAPKLDGEVGTRLEDGRLQKGDDFFEPTKFHLLFRPLWAEVMARDIPGTNPEPIGSGPVSINYLFVLSNAASTDQEDAYNSWYDLQHVPDVLRVPGFVSAQRYVRIGGDAQKPRYMVIFKFKTRDNIGTNAEIRRRIKEGITRMSPAFGMSPEGMRVGGAYVPTGHLVLAPGAKR